MRWSVAAASLLALSFVVACGSGAGDEPGGASSPGDTELDFELRPPKHVLFIVIDTLRADHLSAYGYGVETSPAIDTLARSGVLFQNAISQSSWTVPSMISMMTGRYVSAERMDMPEGLPVLAESFKAAGYRTGAFIHNPILSRSKDFGRGFDKFQVNGRAEPGSPVPDWLIRNRGRKTFTYVHYTDPHDPYGSQTLSKEIVSSPRELDPEHKRWIEGFAAESREEFADVEGELEEIREQIARYDSDVLHCDGRVDTLMMTISRLGLLNDTAIIVASDHGECLWTREAMWNAAPRRKRRTAGDPPTLELSLMSGHGGLLHPELVRVPLIVVAPGLPPGVVGEVVENVDIFPTLLEICDLPLPDGLQGRSLIDVARGGRSDWRQAKPVAFSMTRQSRTVVTQDGWQLIWPSDLGECQEGMVPELYDLRADPDCRRNLAASEPERVAKLRALIEERLAQGIPGNDLNSLSAEDLALLEANGYVDGGLVDLPLELYRRMSFDELLGEMDGAPCLVRLEVARELARRELADAERGRLEALLAEEPSPGVRRHLREAAKG